MARAKIVGERTFALASGWEVAEVVVGPKGEGSIDDPAKLDAHGLAWIPAEVPGTAASALRAAGRWSLGTKRSFDASEWWWRGRFDAAPAETGEQLVLRLDGLATVADVWFNGEPVLTSENMFHEHAVDVTSRVRPQNEIAIRFRALTALLAQRRPRPRWRTRLVDQQQLRWFRTTLLGRIPGWTPPVACVGPWRGITLERSTTLAIASADARAHVEGADGVVRVALRVHARTQIDGATLHVGDARAELTCRASDQGDANERIVEGELRLPNVRLWWPHTHGAQPLYPAKLTLRSGDARVEVSLGRLGFRTITLVTEGDAFGLRVNGVDVFCRGACWTTTDIVSLGGSADAYAHAVGQARAAGMNMLRVGGTMVYEADAFYEACDEQGILVWQDFMFANMDYPGGDEAFAASVRREAEELLSRTQTSPSLAIMCGNSEVEQQVAMLGLPREQWTQPLFSETLPQITRTWRPDLPYVASTPTGGTLPFQVSAGVSHYYGVGAYLRPLEDARRAEVRFTSECLGFSNIPEDATIEQVVGDGQSPFHHPAWKERVPRDSGPGWDFEDVRDHYTQLLFGVDPMRLRYADMARYLALGRVTTGEAMASAIAEWRRNGSTCRGALVWFYRDLWPGAGWGLIDATGLPKAAYYYARRAMQPVALLIADEGLNGLVLHALNETAAPIDAEVKLALYRQGDVRVAEGKAAVVVPARSGAEIRGDGLFEHFLDTTYAYRFGPPAHDFAVATMHDRASGARLGEAFHFPQRLPSSRESDIGVEATAEAADAGDAGAWRLTVRAKKLAQSVAIDAPGFLPDDDYFHIAPGDTKQVTLRPAHGKAPPAKAQGTVQPLNALAPTKIAFTPARA